MSLPRHETRTGINQDGLFGGMTRMGLPDHKTKIVATIGPASDSPDMLVRLIRAGLDIARLNLSHGDFGIHLERITRIREAERATGKRVAILIDLPGPKMRIGTISPEPVTLRRGDRITLSTDDVVGTADRASVTFERLPQVVKPGDTLFLNDGLIQLHVMEAAGHDVVCAIEVGGELRSRKGLNLPGIDLGITAFTAHDKACLEFGLALGVDAVSQSFVETAADIDAVRAAAWAFGRDVFVIAKIERAGALQHYDEILATADGVMVARGDLGVEVPLEHMAITQKELIAKANIGGKPVITATQMLESMVTSRLPTRAEATDVANAILDGTDCVMLSAESAVGQFPEEAVQMLARIAAATEPHRTRTPMANLFGTAARASALRWPADVAVSPGNPSRTSAEAIASVVEHALETVRCGAVFVPTRTGTTARLLSRYKPAAWTISMSRQEGVAAGLVFSYGVFPVVMDELPDDWRHYVKTWLAEHDVSTEVAMLVAGPSSAHPDASHRIEFLRIGTPETLARLSSDATDSDSDDLRRSITGSDGICASAISRDEKTNRA